MATPSSNDISTWASQYGQQYGVPPSLVLSVIQQESGGISNAVNTNSNGTTDVGLMQLNSSNFDSSGNFSPNSQVQGFNPNDPQQNVQAGTAYLSYLTNYYNGDTTKAVAAYNAGTGAVNSAVSQYGDNWQQGLPSKTQTYVNNVEGTQGTGLQPNQNNANTSYSLNPDNTLDPDPMLAAPLTVNDITDQQYQALTPPTQINTGLDVTPWYSDTNLLTGNPKLHMAGYPVTFEIVLDAATNTRLVNPTTQQPISILLNASISQYGLSSQHVVDKRQSRTGLHFTFWGMQADLLTGQASTGLFLNQFGMTDFFSVSTIPSSVTAAIQNAFQNSPGVLNAILTNNGQLRVAAQDAFIEFLYLFKNNSVTWLHPNNYSWDSTTSTSDTSTQSSTAAYSATAGSSDFQIKARNNDVYTRGYVLMKFRSSTYLGYFKSLNWTLDASKPFSWNFNFVFQVERTLSLAYIGNQQPQITTGTTGPNYQPAPTAPVITDAPLGYDGVSSQEFYVNES